MNCPLSPATLVDYFAGDLPAEQAEAVDEHLFSCDTCFEAAGKVGAMASTLQNTVPPVVLPEDLERARARGAVTESNEFLPGDEKEAWLRRGVDVLVHRLVLPEPEAFEHVSVEFETLDGAPMFAYPDAPLDPAGGAVLIACQRHFAALVSDHDVRIRVRGTTASGSEKNLSYTVLHRYE